MNYEAYRTNKIESGLLYQDFVVDCCWTLLGLAIVQYASRTYQYNVGETRTGAEIKHDEKFASTGNLWIEVGEKARPREGDYFPSGIRRGDNSWLYIIGDYNTVFLFPVTLLRTLQESGRYRIMENNTKTSTGFLLPAGDARRYAAAVLYPHAEEKVGKLLGDIHARGRALHEALTSPGGMNQMDLFRSAGDDS